MSERMSERMSDGPCIRVDTTEWRPIEARDWRVCDLKAAYGVPAHKALSRIDPFGLTELRDDQTIDVRDGERFISHVRPGVST